VAEVVLFHSILGLRPAEHAWAERLRAAGHSVAAPDLFGGETAASYDDGAALRDRVGWETVVSRARAAVAPLPPETVLAGISMGAGVVGELWPGRPEAAGILLLHGPCAIPADPRPGLPVQAHLGEPEPFDDEGFLADWAEAARKAGLAFELFRYPGAGHYFTDATWPDHDAAAAALAAQRVLAFLDALR
jgi:dienelactone hydrolase